MNANAIGVEVGLGLPGRHMVLQVLARECVAMTALQIAASIDRTPSRTHRILQEMAECGQLVVLPPAPGVSYVGKRPGRYALPQWVARREAKRTPAPPVIFPIYSPGTMVLTPTGRKAVVLRQIEGFCDLEYAREPVRELANVTVHARLLRAYEPGREFPQPVRL